MTPAAVELPHDLVRRARKAGLLKRGAPEAMIPARRRRDSIRELLRRADEVFADPGPPMTMEEIQEEVNAVRAARRRRRLNRL